MLAAWVIASRANGVGSANRESVGPGLDGRRGGGAVAMAEATLPVATAAHPLLAVASGAHNRVHTPFLRRQFGCHVPSVPSSLQLRGCPPLRRAAATLRRPGPPAGRRARRPA